MRTRTLALLVAVGTAMGTTAMAQNLQNDADKGVKTQNSGASGYVGDQQKPGATAQPPGQPENRASNAGANAAAAPSAKNSGAGISGMAGNKNGPPADKGTVGAAHENNQAVQEQDPSNVKGLPGNKSGPAPKAPSR